jgi:hypothetical protein
MTMRLENPQENKVIKINRECKESDKNGMLVEQGILEIEAGEQAPEMEVRQPFASFWPSITGFNVHFFWIQTRQGELVSHTDGEKGTEKMF